MYYSLVTVPDLLLGRDIDLYAFYRPQRASVLSALSSTVLYKSAVVVTPPVCQAVFNDEYVILFDLH